MRVRYFIMILFLILSCEEKTYENPADPDTELGADEWAPSSLTIEILTDSDVKLSWQKSEVEATGFKVERQDTVGGVFVEVGTVDTTIYTDTALIVGDEYLYQVCAYSGDNQSSYATSDTIVTTFPAPYEMSAVPQTDNKINLTWLDSTAYESGFVIERKNIVSDAFTLLDSTQANTYQDTVITLGNQYVYKVGAYSQYNTSSYTDTISVKYWQDCSDIWGGTDVEDNCGTCDSDASNDCNMDCAGNWGGDLEDDNCGVCDGSNIPLTGTCDCHGTPNGEAYTDGCGDCVGGLTGSTACANDCLGVLGGDAVYDNCDTCDNDPENDCLQDCAGTWGGDLVDDACGVCDGDNSPSTGTCDCASTPNGTAVEDCADVCNGTSVLSGCDNVCNSTAVEDCADVCGGDAVEDCTGLCNGSTTGCSVYDVDGNGYTTVTIGTQEWLVQNLKTTKYKDGTDISKEHSDSDWSNLTTGAYAVYNNNSSNADIYGNLYNWYAVETQQLCMEGWHVPTDEEWTVLTDYLGGIENSGGKMKETGTEHWNSPNTGATNESGFTGLPGGYLRLNQCEANWNPEGQHAAFWTSTEYDGCPYGDDDVCHAVNGVNGALHRTLYASGISVSFHCYDQRFFFSVRCLKSVDCAGVVDGSATLDNCGDCVGGDTGETACVQDCAGTWGGTAVEDCAGVCGGTATDTDNDGICDWNDADSYATVQIGAQLWMQENLKVTKYKDGSDIPSGYSHSNWSNLYTGAYAVYDDDPANADIYGHLYNWFAVDDSRGICPEGFHVPSDEEFKELERYLGMSEEEANDTGYRGTNEGSKLAGNSDLWNDGGLVNNSEFGTSGFNGLSAGFHFFSGGSKDKGVNGFFFLSSEYNDEFAWYRVLSDGRSDVARHGDYKRHGCSVRCLGD